MVVTFALEVFKEDIGNCFKPRSDTGVEGDSEWEEFSLPFRL